MGKTEVVEPPAKTLILGLRNMGYNFSTAVADIIDNSVSAEATRIDVISNPYTDSPYLAIFDNGHGMGRKELKNAMVIGSDRSGKVDSPEELGRFGLGLKTASFSQCLCLTVASKDSSHINAMRYDIGKIQEQNNWLLDELDDEEISKIPEIDRLKAAKTGTLVVWENFDTIREETPAGKFVDAFTNAVVQASNHIAFVFHRFYKKIEIYFNERRVPKRDPFLEGYPKTQEGRELSIPFNGETIIVKPYTLPTTNSLTIEQKELLGNPENVSEGQGIYLYRNGRLISWGTWLRMNHKSDFSKLARVRVDIPSALDSIWRIDVKKSSAKVPEDIKEPLRIAIKSAVGSSTRETKYRGKKESEVENPVWLRNVNKVNGTVEYVINREYPLIESLIEDLNPYQRKQLDMCFKKIERFVRIGSISTDESSSNVTISGMGPEPDLDNLEKELVDLVNTLYHGSSEVLEKFLNGQGYEDIRDRYDEMVEQLKDETGA